MTTTTAPRVDIAEDARDLYRAYVALDRAALLYAIVTINGWNRLAVATRMTYEP